LEVVTLDSA